MRSTTAAVLAAFGFLAAFPLAVLAQGPPASVRVDEARSEPLETWRESTGQIRAARRSVLAAEEEGLVAEVLVREGERVEAGQVVARLDDVRAALELRRAQAVLAASKAVVSEREALLENAQRDLERVQETFDRGGGNEREIDTARTGVSAARARLEAAKADVVLNEVLVDLAQTRVEDMTIRAPFSGRIVRRIAEAGQWVGLGDSLAEVVSLDTVEAWVDVPERLIDRLAREDGRVRVRVPATGLEIEADSYTIVPDADPRSRLFPVRIVLSNDEERFRPGMSVQGLTPTGVTEPTLTVHKDAMLRDDAGEFVYFAAPGPEGGFQAIPARVTRLFAAGDRVAIRAGALPPGAMVVVEGNERMFPTQPLNILNMPADGGVAPAGAPGQGS
ncbi:MAG: efflux RND transporter periplasmic adaptor subunit [Phycisphaerales bacterium]|jgi:RND family efflux transporter MFP subunit